MLFFNVRNAEEKVGFCLSKSNLMIECYRLRQKLFGFFSCGKNKEKWLPTPDLKLFKATKAYQTQTN